MPPEHSRSAWNACSASWSRPISQRQGHQVRQRQGLARIPLDQLHQRILRRLAAAGLRPDPGQQHRVQVAGLLDQPEALLGGAGGEGRVAHQLRDRRVDPRRPIVPRAARRRQVDQRGQRLHPAADVSRAEPRPAQQPEPRRVRGRAARLVPLRRPRPARPTARYAERPSRSRRRPASASLPGRSGAFQRGCLGRAIIAPGQLDGLGRPAGPEEVCDEAFVVMSISRELVRQGPPAGRQGERQPGRGLGVAGRVAEPAEPAVEVGRRVPHRRDPGHRRRATGRRVERPGRPPALPEPQAVQDRRVVRRLVEDRPQQGVDRQGPAHRHAVSVVLDELPGQQGPRLGVIGIFAGDRLQRLGVIEPSPAVVPLVPQIRRQRLDVGRLARADRAAPRLQDQGRLDRGAGPPLVGDRRQGLPPSGDRAAGVQGRGLDERPLGLLGPAGEDHAPPPDRSAPGPSDRACSPGIGRGRPRRPRSARRSGRRAASRPDRTTLRVSSIHIRSHLRSGPARPAPAAAPRPRRARPGRPRARSARLPRRRRGLASSILRRIARNRLHLPGSMAHRPVRRGFVIEAVRSHGRSGLRASGPSGPPRAGRTRSRPCR